MTFNASIPQAAGDPAISQGQLLTNFTQLNTIFGNNHITFDAGANNGKHTFCQFVEQGAAPATAANEVAIYALDTGTQPDLFVRPESGGPEIRLTGGGLTPGVYGTFSGIPVLAADSLNISGVIRNGLGNYTVSFTRSFANTNYILSVSPFIAGSSPLVTSSNTKNVGSVTFEIRQTRTGALFDPDEADILIFGLLA